MLSLLAQGGVQGRYCGEHGPLLDPERRFTEASPWRLLPNGGRMGDKSPKAKQRGQKQKDAARAEGAAQAKSKQDSYRQTPSIPGKGKR